MKALPKFETNHSIKRLNRIGLCRVRIEKDKAGMLKTFTSLLVLLSSGPVLAQQTVAPPAKVDSQPIAPPVSVPPVSAPLPVVPAAPLPQTLPTLVPSPSVVPFASTPAPVTPPSTPLPQAVPQQAIPAPVNPPVTAPPSTTQPAPVLIAPPAIISPDPASEPNILELNIEARPVLTLKNEASNEEGFAVIRRDIARLSEDAKKAGIVIVGRPFAVIDLTDDQKFKFEVMLPIEKPASGVVPMGLNLGLSPMGKAIRFKFTGAYDESAYVYESIEAYIEEKNIIARNYAIEEYLNDPKDGNDTELQMYIYYLRD